MQLPDVDELFAELQREFGTAADIAAALPMDTPVRTEVPLLAERIRTAAATADRLLAAWTRSRTNTERVDGCADQVRRLATTVIALHDTLIIAAREPACEQAVQRVQRAAAQLDDAVEAIHVETTASLPPRTRHT